MTFKNIVHSNGQFMESELFLLMYHHQGKCNEMWEILRFDMVALIVSLEQ